MQNTDEWKSFADLLGNLIAKYAEVLDFDSMPDPVTNSEDTKIHEKQDTCLDKAVETYRAA